MQFSYTWSSLFVCTLLARARMSKLKSQIHQLIMDFVPGKVTTVTGFRIVNKFAAFYLTLLSNCGSILAIAAKFANSQGNLLPPPSSRAISFTISISAAAAKTGNKSKVIKAVAQRQEGRGGRQNNKVQKQGQAIFAA